MGQKEYSKITILNQIVDTLKLQFYPTTAISFTEIENFNNKIDELVILKKEAMKIKAHDSQKRYKQTYIQDIKFNVMAQAQNSFNVVLQNGDISISLLKFLPTHNNPLIKVEFRAEYLLRQGYEKAINQVKVIINSLLDSYVIRVSELHLATDIQGYEFTEFDFHRMGSSSKTKTVFNADCSSKYYFGAKFTGFSLGKGDEMLRIYNKTVEISQNHKKGFISVLSWHNNPDFDDTSNVWRIEFQIRRPKLKKLLGKDGLLDTLENVINALEDIWKYFVTKYQHKNYSNQLIMEKIQGFKRKKDGEIKILTHETLRKRFSRAELSYVWDSIQLFENKKGCDLDKFVEISKPEKIYVENAYKALVSTFIKLNRGDFNSHELTKILLEADRDNKELKGYSIVDGARIKALDYIVKSKTYYENTGLISDGFEDFKKDIYHNLHDTFALFENEPSNIITFKEFQKRLI